VGYYDLSDPEVLVRQADMAKKYGIYGFAFYHYWFNGKRLLERPLDYMLKTGKPDFPFCLIWANENWTKRWDGLNNEIIQEQKYSLEDDIAHMMFLCSEIFPNKNYIKIDDKPVFLVYRTELLPDPAETAKRWRSVARDFGYKDLYLIRIEGFETNISPKSIYFDAALEFAPDRHNIGLQLKIDGAEDSLIIRDYETTVQRIAAKLPSYKTFRCVFPSWDNTARRKDKGVVFINNSPFYFEFHLRMAVQYTIENMAHNERFLFINSWNEWGEGCHVEPDEKFNDVFMKLINHYKDTFSPTENYLRNFDSYFSQLGLKYYNTKIQLDKLNKHLHLFEKIVRIKRSVLSVFRPFR
jgi:lipopolysaccharide biosynthesis protein